MKTKTTLLAILFGTGILSAQTPAKKVMLEEFTTTLCGMCPPQSWNVHEWYAQHTSTSVLMTHHSGFGTDAMTTADATTYANYFQPKSFGFAPAIMIDRDVYTGVDTVPYMSVNGFDTIAQRVSANTADVAVDIQGSYNSNTRQITLTASATFVNAVAAGEKRIQLFIVEDSLIGTGSGWDQKCYSSSFANLHFPGQYTSPYIMGYPHRNVQRASLSGGTWGTAGVIPTTPAIGTPYSVTLTYTLPANFNDARISIIGFVANYGANHVSREILNANSVKLKDLTNATGVAEQVHNAEINAMYPNPATNEVTMSMTILNSGNTSIIVSNLAGQQVAEFEKGTFLNSGRYSATFNTENLVSGMYIVTLKNGDDTIIQKLSVSK